MYYKIKQIVSGTVTCKYCMSIYRMRHTDSERKRIEYLYSIELSCLQAKAGFVSSL